MRKALARGMVLAAVLAGLAGCGDAVPRGVEVVTQPPGATVRLGKHALGKSPVLIPRKLMKDHVLGTLTLEIAKDGYRTRYLVLDQVGGVLRVSLPRK